ncbi:AAEL012191-PA [Aedes aegypti]|uniref:AAEL012191-PA n=1 Tax=Aedes aegypti TaxID=7159 RepID=Q16MU2_AEDAE|nr:AAEL012191-PA [Aedes aegypti]
MTARWRENRTIFNTPNPRLMNVSLLRDNKLLHGQERRGSRMSVRLPSRQPSMASLRPHSPNASIGKLGLYAGNRFPFPFLLHYYVDVEYTFYGHLLLEEFVIGFSCVVFDVVTVCTCTLRLIRFDAFL